MIKTGEMKEYNEIMRVLDVDGKLAKHMENGKLVQKSDAPRIILPDMFINMSDKDVQEFAKRVAEKAGSTLMGLQEDNEWFIKNKLYPVALEIAMSMRDVATQNYAEASAAASTKGSGTSTTSSTSVRRTNANNDMEATKSKTSKQLAVGAGIAALLVVGVIVLIMVMRKKRPSGAR